MPLLVITAQVHEFELVADFGKVVPACSGSHEGCQDTAQVGSFDLAMRDQVMIVLHLFHLELLYSHSLLRGVSRADLPGDLGSFLLFPLRPVQGFMMVAGVPGGVPGQEPGTRAAACAVH